MRYLGNKELIIPEISKLLQDKGLLDNKLCFFDAFCGTGTVAASLKGFYDIKINDNLLWSTVYTKGKLYSSECTFHKLGFDPIDYLNSNQSIRKDFIYNNYSPGGSNRMYFTAENAGRIDYFRNCIEEWYISELINHEEYCYLLACLIESVSDVSNTAGVYGAFLKKWDSRALKPIIFDTVDSNNIKVNSLKVYNSKIEDIIDLIDCDILYLDPPYTQNQYGTQYHLLETLIRYDNPKISKVTGSRSTTPMRSNWSKEYYSNILFDKLLARTKAKYIVFSYSIDGFMSKEFIEASMKRYGKKETFECRKISYKKYQNWKSKKCTDEHFEYLFFIEMKSKDEVVYESPLNYTGNKARIIYEIKSRIPNSYDTFLDLFGGGFNVGINIKGNKIIYNDINYMVKDIIQSFRDTDTVKYLQFIKKTINKFDLEKGKAASYIAARDYYNSLPKDKRDPKLLFTIILYGFHQQIRFNSKHEFNNPPGNRWFNDKIFEKMISFSRKIKEENYIFENKNFIDLENIIDKNTFVYLDPPYKLTTGSYNDGKRGFNGWDDVLEQELYKFTNDLTMKNIPFMLSYVLEHAGKVNYELEAWIKTNGYTLIELGDILGISGSRRKEVLIVNYDVYESSTFYCKKESSKI